jgi:transposase
MGARAQLKLDLVVKVLAGQMDRKVAQGILNVSSRTLERYLAEYRTLGPGFMEHGNFGRSPVNKSSWEVKLRVQDLVRTKYPDFNLTHLREKLEQDEKIQVQRETLRSWCHEIKHVKRAKRRRAKARYARQRMRQTGMLLQMDGSHHRWFGGVPSCLIAAIDDASSEIPFAEFFLGEDTISCMRVLQRIIEKKGLFQILYVDRAGIFGGGGSKRENFSQVKRALKELGIHVIFAQSPEAKGRVERLFGTLQDRLVAEMRLRQIKTYPAANAFLQDQFLPNHWHQRFSVPAADPRSAYVPLPPGTLDLKEVFCMKEHRVVQRDHTLSYGNQTYRLESPVGYSIYRQSIEIRTYQDLTWKAFYAGKPIELTLFEKANRHRHEPALNKAA